YSYSAIPIRRQSAHGGTTVPLPHFLYSRLPVFRSYFVDVETSTSSALASRPTQSAVAPQVTLTLRPQPLTASTQPAAAPLPDCLSPCPSAPHCLDATTPTVPPHSPLPAGGGNHHNLSTSRHSAVTEINPINQAQKNRITEINKLNRIKKNRT
ncbi:hypothetical protein HAX54_005229, partial [Datura stramonium]|nr:hypothetical protein [Datura stramonium]